MRTFKGLLFSALGSALILISCGDGTSNGEATNADSAGHKTPITLANVGSSPEYPDAQLSFGAVTTVKQGEDSTKVTFNFNVKNYELKKHWLAHTKKICPRCNLPFIKKYAGETKRRTFYCEYCQGAA